ncbi:MAG: hypothetical protein Q9214_006995, partial [Letrouitia sp. 1 TL-2023]
SVNARGTFLGCKYAAQQFLSQELDANGERGCIINVTSVAGFLGIFECGKPIRKLGSGGPLPSIDAKLKHFERDSLELITTWLLGAYCASKASSQGLTRAIAIEYASRGIRCNTIAVGLQIFDAENTDIESSMLAPFLAKQEFSSYLATVIPARRLGRPSDVANAAVWLGSSAESAYVNGVILPVDGGFSAR